MRIAIEASTWVNTRGYGRFTRELTLALLRAGSSHQFSLVVDSGAAAHVPRLPHIDVVVVPTRQAVVEAATAESARTPIDMARMSMRLSRGFDAVLFPTNYSFVPVLPGRFVAVVIHDAIPEAMPELVLGSRRSQMLWRVKNRLACWQADVIATVSQASAREILKRLPVGKKQPLVLTEGAASVFSQHAAADDDALRRSVIPNVRRYVLFVGGLSPHKRVAELVKAFGEVTRSPGYDDLSLVLAGPDGRDQFAADQSGVAEATARLGDAGRRVIRTGFVSDEALAALYRGAACVVLPSSAEGFGLPALEAMSSGAPLIAARNAALEEVCADAAEYVEDIEQLGAILGRVLADSARRVALSRAGIERARHFGWDEAARRLLAAFDSSDPSRGRHPGGA